MILRLTPYAIFVVVIIAAVILVATEHRLPNEGFPVINAALRGNPPPSYMFAPCPVAPRNFHPQQERKA
jgi:hypothetical protein